MHVHAALQRGFQIIRVVATASGSLLGSGILGLPRTLLVIRNGDVSLLSDLLLLGGVSLRLLADGSAEADDLFKDHLAHVGDFVDDLEVEVESRGAVWLVGGIVPNVQVGVLESLLDRDTRRRIKCQHAVQQVQRIRVGLREQLLEGDLGHEGQIAHVFLGARGTNACQGFLVRCAQVVQDLVQLVDVVATLEEGPAAEELGKDAAHGPDVNCRCGVSGDSAWVANYGMALRTCFGIALEAQHNLRCTVPSGCNVLGHVACVLLRVDRETTGQAEVTNLELAVGIDQQVTGFEIAVQDVGRVDVLETTEDLVDEGLEVGIGQRLAGADDRSQITFHQLCRIISPALSDIKQQSSAYPHRDMFR